MRAWSPDSASANLGIGFLGMTRMWTGACGLISLKARAKSSS